MPVERWFFDPDELAKQLQVNMANALRTLADAVDSGQVDALLVGCNAHGLSRNWRDTRAHMLVKIDLAAQIHLPVSTQLEHGERKELP